MPTASEASAMEAAGHTVAETTGVGETHTMTDITHAMAEAAAYVVAAGNVHTHAVAETATSKMGDIYAAVGEPSPPKWGALMLRPKPMP